MVGSTFDGEGTQPVEMTVEFAAVVVQLPRRRSRRRIFGPNAGPAPTSASWSVSGGIGIADVITGAEGIVLPAAIIGSLMIGPLAIIGSFIMLLLASMDSPNIGPPATIEGFAAFCIIAEREVVGESVRVARRE